MLVANWWEKVKQVVGKKGLKLLFFSDITVHRTVQQHGMLFTDRASKSPQITNLTVMKAERVQF